MPSKGFDYKFITPAIGAEFLEMPKGPLSKKLQGNLRTLLVDRKVLVFRNQKWSAQEFLDFMKTFGIPYAEDLKPQDDNPPEVGEIKIRPNERQTINFWHMDYSFTEKPARILALHAKQIPPCGGDTLFTNLEAAYEGLDQETKERIDPLFGNHKMDVETQNAKNRWTREELEAMNKAPPLKHPLVCTNPENKRKYLFVNVPIFCGSICDMENEEGEALLRQLYLHAQRPEYSFRLSWKEDTLVVWENDHCLHYPVADYFPHERKLLRVAIQGVGRPQRLA